MFQFFSPTLLASPGDKIFIICKCDHPLDHHNAMMIIISIIMMIKGCQVTRPPVSWLDFLTTSLAGEHHHQVPHHLHHHHPRHPCNDLHHRHYHHHHHHHFWHFTNLFNIASGTISRQDYDVILKVFASNIATHMFCCDLHIHLLKHNLRGVGQNNYIITIVQGEGGSYQDPKSY